MDTDGARMFMQQLTLLSLYRGYLISEQEGEEEIEKKEGEMTVVKVREKEEFQNRC